MELSTKSKLTTITIICIVMLSITTVMKAGGSLSNLDEAKINHWTNGTATIINDIPSSINSSLKKSIYRILKGYKYTKEYKENIFDCSDMSIITCNLLQDNGFNAQLMFRQHKSAAHLWIVVLDWANQGVFIECSDTPNQLGRITAGNAVDFEYDSGWMMTPKEYENTFSDVEKTATMIDGADYRDYIIRTR